MTNEPLSAVPTDWTVVEFDENDDYNQSCEEESPEEHSDTPTVAGDGAP